MTSRQCREGGSVYAVYVHAGAGFHSYANERNHLTACQDAASAAYSMLKNEGTALDAVELAIKVFEDREITNAGYGSNLCMDGIVECDASIVDHHGRSGAAGAVSQVKNPITLARLILEESTRPLSLQRVPPNLLVGPGATDYAAEHGLLIVFNDYMVSRGAQERWSKWKKDLNQAEEQENGDLGLELRCEPSVYPEPNFTNQGRNGSPSEMKPPLSPPSARHLSAQARVPSPHRPLVASTADLPETYFDVNTQNHAKYLGVPAPALSDPIQVVEADRNANIDGNMPADGSDVATDDDHPWAAKRRRLSKSNDGSIDNSLSPSGKNATAGSPRLQKPRPVFPASDRPSRRQHHDRIIDTVGAIAVDRLGNIAAGSSSGGIGMKHRGRCGPAALVGIGTAVIPTDLEDVDETSVATVTSGTGEHMATTLAAATCADRVYSSVRKLQGGQLEECSEDEAMKNVIDREFMGHPGVRHSHCMGAIGIMAVKKTRYGIRLHFGHNTDSFAIASMQTGDRKPHCVMSRSSGNGSIAQGGRAVRY